MFIGKISNQTLLHLLFVSTILKRSFKVKRIQLIKCLKPVSNVSTNSIQSLALQKKIPSPRNRVFPENNYVDFITNDRIKAFNNINERNCPAGNTLWDIMITLHCRDRLQTNIIYHKLENASEYIISYL